MVQKERVPSYLLFPYTVHGKKAGKDPPEIQEDAYIFLKG